MVHVQHRLGVSKRRACRVLSQARSTHRHRPVVPDDEPRLVARLIELATQYGRYGYRRITGLSLGSAVRRAACDVINGRLMVSHANDDGSIEAGCGSRMARAFASVLSIGTTSGRMTLWRTARMTAGR